MSTEFFEIDVEKLKRMQMLHVHFILLDIRSKDAFDRSHIQNAFHLDASQFAEKIKTMVPDKTMPIVVYDEDGKTTASFLQEAADLGFVNVVGLTGGYQAYLL